MRMIVTRRLPEKVLEAAAKRFDLVLRDSDSHPGPDDLVAMLRDFDVVLCTLGDRFSAEVFAACPAPRTRLLANFGAGFNHIDITAARAAGLEVTNTPGAVTDATADIAMGLILSTARRLGEGERMLRAGAWTGWAPTQMLGTHVTGKRLGVIGMGRIGRAVAKRCHFGFDMEVVFWNRSTLADPGVPARQVGFEEALAADFVLLGLAANAGTHHLINAKALSAMRPEGILINVSRGDVIDEAALITALKAGRIRGAGLDVFEFEPEVPEALRSLENVTLLPHLGTASLEVREEMGFMALGNAIALLEGRALETPVPG